MTDNLKTTTSVTTIDTATTVGSHLGRSAGFALVVASVLAGATGALVAQVAAASERSAGSEAVLDDAGADTSFEQAEHRRHLSIVQDRADGFDVVERTRFERLSAQDAMADLNGFEFAEQARFERLSD